MEAETTMICMDTSNWMQSVESRRFKKQADAIKLYCSKNLKSHPQNVVGVCGMGEKLPFCLIKPTRDLRKIMNAIYCARIGGVLLLSEAISYASGILLSSPESHMQKKMVVFAGGVVFQPKLEGEALGKMMKERNLACDVVNFGDQSANKKELFDTLIAAADNNGNCHILHVERRCSVHRALSRSPIIPQVEDGESTKVAVTTSLPMEDEREKQKREFQRVSQKIQQAKMNTPTQEIVKLKLEDKKKKEQIDALTRENENLKRELELSRKEKNQVLSAIDKLYELASKGTSATTIPQIQWNFLPKPALTNIPGYYADAVKTFQTEIASIFVNEIAKNL